MKRNGEEGRRDMILSGRNREEQGGREAKGTKRGRRRTENRIRTKKSGERKGKVVG